MLAFIADPRTGLGYKHDFTISNFELMKQLPQLLRTKRVEEILSLPDFQERVKLYHEENKKYEELITRSARTDCLRRSGCLSLRLRAVTAAAGDTFW